MSKSDKHIEIPNKSNHHYSDEDSGFTVPEHYFMELEKAIHYKTVNHGFTVPEGYFEDAENGMMNQILAQSKAVNKHKRTFKIAYLSLAASLLLISGLFFTNILSKRTSAPKADFSSISEDDIIQYIDADDLNNSHVEPLTDASVETYLISTDENLLIDPL